MTSPCSPPRTSTRTASLRRHRPDRALGPAPRRHPQRLAVRPRRAALRRRPPAAAGQERRRQVQGPRAPAAVPARRRHPPSRRHRARPHHGHLADDRRPAERQPRRLRLARAALVDIDGDERFLHPRRRAQGVDAPPAAATPGSSSPTGASASTSSSTAPASACRSSGSRRRSARRPSPRRAPSTAGGSGATCSGSSTRPATPTCCTSSTASATRTSATGSRPASWPRVLSDALPPIDDRCSPTRPAASTTSRRSATRSTARSARPTRSAGSSTPTAATRAPCCAARAGAVVDAEADRARPAGRSRQAERGARRRRAGGRRCRRHAGRRQRRERVDAEDERRALERSDAYRAHQDLVDRQERVDALDVGGRHGGGRGRPRAARRLAAERGRTSPAPSPTLRRLRRGDPRPPTVVAGRWPSTPGSTARCSARYRRSHADGVARPTTPSGGRRSGAGRAPLVEPAAPGGRGPGRWPSAPSGRSPTPTPPTSGPRSPRPTSTPSGHVAAAIGACHAIEAETAWADDVRGVDGGTLAAGAAVPTGRRPVRARSTVATSRRPGPPTSAAP